MKPKILITRYVFPAATSLIEGFAELEYNDAHESLDAERLVRSVSDKHALVSQITDSIDQRVMENAPLLKVISNVAVGFDNIDVAAATRRGIAVTNTPGILTETTADFAFSLIMAVARRISEAERYIRAGRWKQWEINQFSGQDIHGRTLGILGMGRIGQSTARRAAGFGMRILYHSTTQLSATDEEKLGLVFVGKEELLKSSDFVSIHLPLNEQTRHYVSTAELALMKPTAILVNTSRGPIIDEQALTKALSDQKIAGAGLDVFEQEPHITAGLLNLENVVLTPHIGSSSIATRTAMCVMAVRNSLAMLRGEDPPNVVNPEYLDYL